MAAGASLTASRHNSRQRRDFSIGPFRTCPPTRQFWTFASGVNGITPKITALSLHRRLSSRTLTRGGKLKSELYVGPPPLLVTFRFEARSQQTQRESLASFISLISAEP